MVKVRLFCWWCLLYCCLNFMFFLFVCCCCCCCCLFCFCCCCCCLRARHNHNKIAPYSFFNWIEVKLIYETNLASLAPCYLLLLLDNLVLRKITWQPFSNFHKLRIVRIESKVIFKNRFILKGYSLFIYRVCTLYSSVQFVSHVTCLFEWLFCYNATSVPSGEKMAGPIFSVQWELKIQSPTKHIKIDHQVTTNTPFSEIKVFAIWLRVILVVTGSVFVAEACFRLWLRRREHLQANDRQ